MPIFKVLRGKPQRIFGAVEQLAGEGDLISPVHLRFDDIDRAGAAVADAARALQVVHGDERGDYAVEDAFRCGLALAVEYAGVHHQVADVAHQQQAAAVQGQRLTVGRGVDAVGIEAAGHLRAALHEGLRQRAVHQAQPVAVGGDLVLGIDGGDRVLQIYDSGDGGLE